MMSESILVTGGTGFIGRWMVVKLTQQGHQVWVLARKAMPRTNEYRLWIQQHGGNPDLVTMVDADLSLPSMGLTQQDRNAFQSISVIFHMGAAFQWDLPWQVARQTTVMGSEAIMELASTLPQLKRIVHVSGYMAAAKENWKLLGLDPEQQDAAQPLTDQQIQKLYKTMGAYEAAKIESHFVMWRLASKHNLPLTSVLPSSTIGHSQTGEIDQPHGMPLLIEKIHHGKFPILPGNDQHRMPVITVDYLVDFMAGIMTLPQAENKSYVLLDQSTPNFPTLINWLSDGLGRKPPRLQLPKWLVQKTLALGLGKIMGMSAETLDFLQPYQFDTEEADRIADQLGLTKPNIRQAVDHMVAYWLEKQTKTTGEKWQGSLN